MQNILLIFLGSFLTFLATIIIESYKNKREYNSKKNNFKLIVKQEFQGINKTLEKLKTVFEYKNYFEYAILNSLDKSVHDLESIRHDSIYLNNEVLQGKYINLISELSKFALSIRGVQDLFYNQQRALSTDKLNATKIKKGFIQKESIFNTEKENQEIFQQKSTQEFINLVEINRRLDEIISTLEK
ncbi:MAG: hypothetical protein Q7R43_04880 [Candidatus Daviesbacteria bacterium]|nr:hypothetical protein [Candidatus Daviesbacteria bacterium]